MKSKVIFNFDPKDECPGDCRCACGSLLARLVPGGVEVKCRRCKRTQVLPLAAPSAPVAVRRDASSAALGEAG